MTFRLTIVMRGFKNNMEHILSRAGFTYMYIPCPCVYTDKYLCLLPSQAGDSWTCASFIKKVVKYLYEELYDQRSVIMPRQPARIGSMGLNPPPPPPATSALPPATALALPPLPPGTAGTLGIDILLLQEYSNTLKDGHCKDTLALGTEA